MPLELIENRSEQCQDMMLFGKLKDKAANKFLDDDNKIKIVICLKDIFEVGENDLKN